MNRPAPTRLAFAMIAWTAACSEPNQAPFSCGPTPPQTVDMRESISFMPCFTDPDADPLTISAEVAHHQQVFVTTSVSGETVTLHGTREHGLLPVTVTATDPAGLYAMEEVGETHAKHSVWTLRVSSDSVITTADSIFLGIPLELYDMAPGAVYGHVRRIYTNHDPGKPYFGLCGVSETLEYNLANNCSKGLKVIFPESTAEGLRHSSASGFPRGSLPPEGEASKHQTGVAGTWRWGKGKSLWPRNDPR